MEIDYKKLGFKCGIEIHQQLEGKKLFCDCPTIIRKDKPDFIIERRLRAAAGEQGKIDIAAKHEEAKHKYFNYQGYYDTTCLVELDEEPPGPVNPDALKITLQVAQLLNCKIVDELQFMRKTVIDGSNVSGFQRTGLVATDGYMEVNGKKIGIESICLEEEACQVIERKKDHDVYNLSRLGIPLLEIATAPDISSAEECKEAALKIGMILRSVDGIKRGIGTIRQDVNVSIKNGTRTEIKGFQEVKSIPSVIEHEVTRQINEIKKGKKIEKTVRKAEPNGTTSFLRPMPGAARMYPETDVAPTKNKLRELGKVELIDDKIIRYEKLGLSKDLATKLAKSEKSVLFDELKLKNVKSAFLAEILVSYPADILRNHKGSDPLKIKDEHLKELFSALDKGEIAKESINEILVEVAKGKTFDLSKHKLMSDKDLEKELKKIISENRSIPFNALIGKAMGKLRGKAEGKKIAEMLKKLS